MAAEKYINKGMTSFCFALVISCASAFYLYFFKGCSFAPFYIMMVSVKWSSCSFPLFYTLTLWCWEVEIFICDRDMLLFSHWELTFPAPSLSFLLPQPEIARFQALKINNPSYHRHSTESWPPGLYYSFVSKPQSLKLFDTFVLYYHVNTADMMMQKHICMTRWYTLGMPSMFSLCFY